MERTGPGARKVESWFSRRIEAKGLRPRYAAGLIATVWLAAVIVFGVIEHWIDPDTFSNVWLGMWWALQTVTTVGYGDVVPENTVGKVIASLLMLGGLSLLAVITGVVTSAFVTLAQERRRLEGKDPAMRKLNQIAAELESVRDELKRLRSDG